MPVNDFSRKSGYDTLKLKIEKVANIFILSNSFWNFIIYSARDARFRGTVVNILSGKKQMSRQTVSSFT